jgi:hypothetical protein
VPPFLGAIDVISINKLLQSIARLITVNENGMTISLSTNETTTINIPPYNNAYVIPLRTLPIPIVVEELQEPEELLRAEAPLANANDCPDLLSVDPLLPLPVDDQREADGRRARLRLLLTGQSTITAHRFQHVNTLRTRRQKRLPPWASSPLQRHR